MAPLLAARTYVVLAVACLLGFGGGALLVAVDSPGILFYLLAVLLVGLYTMQALKPGAGVRHLRRGPTEPSGRQYRVPPRAEEAEPSTDAEPPTRGAFLTVNHGLAGGWLDATKQVERARKTVWVEPGHRWGGTPVQQTAGRRPTVYS